MWPRLLRYTRMIGLTISVMLIFTSTDPAAAQRRRPTAMEDDQIVAEAQMVESGEHVEVYQHRLVVNPAFLKLAEDAYQKLEQLMGVKYDEATLGRKVRIYISDFVSVSHVWKGYNHPTEPKGIIFLNQRVYLGALKGTNATYIHEMAHLFSWRFQSHTLREGLADYMALKILPGTGVGPSAEGYDWSTAIPSEVIEYLGTTRPPPQWVTTDAVKRRAYYFASYRLVKYLIDTKGLETFMKLYKSDSPETEVRSLYGLSREEAIRAAGM